MEEWKDVPGYEGLYQVSDQGRVRSFPRVVVEWDPRWGSQRERRIKGRTLTPFQSGKGYLQVALHRDGRGDRFYVHQLVLIAFIGPCPDGKECCHGNGNPADNRLENLRWGTKTENLMDAVRHGTFGLGEDHHKAKLTEEDVRSIRLLYKRRIPGHGAESVAKQFGVCPNNIRAIVQGKTWRHVK